MIRRASQLASVLAFSLAAFTAQADCPYPKAPASVPSGSTATEPEMLAAMQAFKTYNEEVKAFQACLDAESKDKAASGGQTMQFKTMQSKKLAAAVEELESKAKAFNEQVRIFKAKAS
jgi:predicted outer membrane protein